MKADPSVTTPEQYIAQVPETRRPAIQTLHNLIKHTVPGLEPHIRYGMLGYGPTPYKTKSGCEGEWFVVGLANQKNYMSLYLCVVENGSHLAEANAGRLGKVDCGKSCIRFRKLENLDQDVLVELLQKAEQLHQQGNFLQ